MRYFLLELLPLHLTSAVLWILSAYFVFRIVGKITQGQYDRLARMPQVETQPVRREQWGLVSLLLVPLCGMFGGTWGVVAYLELSHTVGTVLGIFACLAAFTGFACGLRANWNNSPKPATGVVGVFFGFLALCVCVAGFAFWL